MVASCVVTPCAMVCVVLYFAVVKLALRVVRLGSWLARLVHVANCAVICCFACGTQAVRHGALLCSDIFVRVLWMQWRGLQ